MPGALASPCGLTPRFVSSQFTVPSTASYAKLVVTFPGSFAADLAKIKLAQTLPTSATPCSATSSSCTENSDDDNMSDPDVVVTVRKEWFGSTVYALVETGYSGGGTMDIQVTASAHTAKTLNVNEELSVHPASEQGLLRTEQMFKIAVPSGAKATMTVTMSDITDSASVYIGNDFAPSQQHNSYTADDDLGFDEKCVGCAAARDCACGMRAPDL